MKIAVFADIHDNLERWEEAAVEIKKANIDLGICCGDIQNIETLKKISLSFTNLYLTLGNADYSLRDRIDLFPENIVWYEEFGEVRIDGKKIAFIHNNLKAKTIAENKKCDIIFYGHTHTPWEERVRNTLLVNPGEICGRYGRPSFAIFDTTKMKAELILLK